MTFQYPVKSLVLSHSTRSSFRRCARLLEFNKLFGDSGDREDSFPAGCGTALHEGFQTYLVTKNENKAIFAFLLAFPHELEYAKTENSSRSLEACYATLEELIRAPICDNYELVHIKNSKGETLPAVEVPFAIEILNSPLPIPVYFVGFIDAILYDKFEQKYIVNDIKTTRMNIQKDYSVRYEFDEQTVPYGIALEGLLGQVIEEFETSYLSAYIDLLEPKVNMYKFTKTQDHIQDWYRGLCEDISRIARYYNAQWFPRATDGNTCFSFNNPCWHNDNCHYRDPETINRIIDGTMREGLFHDGQEPWILAQLEYQEV